MIKQPIILDCDPGIDDAYAIMLANSAEGLDVRAVTVVAGNVEFQHTARNTIDLGDFLKMPTRVAKGAKAPLIVPQKTASKTHGENGLGGYRLPQATSDFDSNQAWDVMYQEAKTCRGKLQIVAVGPLTNIAIAILKYPDLKKHVRRIVMMGGSVTMGNHSPYAEFNVWADPHAAEIVFQSGIPLMMFGLDFTKQCALSEEEMTELGEIKSSVQDLIQGMNRYVFGPDQARTKGGYLTLHDAIAVGYLLDERLATVQKAHVVCELNSIFSQGQTIVDFDCSPGEVNVSVPRRANKEIFQKLLKNMVEFYGA